MDKNIIIKTNKTKKPKNKNRIVRRLKKITRLPRQINTITLDSFETGKNGFGSNPVKLRNIARNDIVSTLQQFHSHVRSRYLLGLVHPDIAVKESIPVKLPSDIPIPTSSVGIRISKQFTTSALGTFLLSWRPCFLVTQPLMTKWGYNDVAQMTYNNHATLDGNTVVTGNYFVPNGYTPNVDLTKYRLVSAMVDVRYNGSVLNQSGTMYASANFQNMPVCAGTEDHPVTEYADPEIDRFGDFGLVRNGLWNQDCNVTKGAEGLQCLYVPMDPDDYMFQNITTYYGSDLVPGAFSPDSEGAHINYLVAGRNLPANSSCIAVEVYYNYEVIADPSAACFMRATADESYNTEDRSKLRGAMSALAKSGGLIRKPREYGFKDILGKIIDKGIEYIPTFLGSLANMI